VRDAQKVLQLLRLAAVLDVVGSEGRPADDNLPARPDDFVEPRLRVPPLAFEEERVEVPPADDLDPFEQARDDVASDMSCGSKIWSGQLKATEPSGKRSVFRPLPALLSGYFLPRVVVPPTKGGESSRRFA
jgi:hypothetical protein